MMVNFLPVLTGIDSLPAGLTLAVAPLLPAAKIKPFTSAVSDATSYSLAKGLFIVSPFSSKLCNFATLFFSRVMLTVFDHAG